MEECLKTIRFLHRALLGLCATIFGFALSPDPTVGPTRIRSELLAAQARIAHFDRDALSQYRRSTLDRALRLDKEVADALRQVSVTGRPNLDSLRSGLTRIQRRALEQVTPPNWKLGLAKELLDEDSDIEVFVPDDLQGELRAVLQPYTGTGASLKSLRYSGLQLAGRPTLEGYADLELSRQDFDQHRTRIQELAKSLPFEPRIRISDTLVGVTLDTRIRGEYRQVEASSFARWMLASGNIDRRLETGSPAQQILGPTVLAYAAEYPETTFADATKTLSEEIAKARESRKLALLGLEVSPERAVLFGPLFTLLLVLFLLVHLGHANTATDEDGSLQAFPWVGLFYGRLARGILASSLILLPLLVNTWLIVSTRSFTLVGSALTLGAIPIGYLAFRSSSRLRFRKVP